MRADDVKKVVLDEVGEQWDRTNLHAVDLRRSMVETPSLRTYVDSFHGNAPLELWLVLEEDPESHHGYEIVFEENEGFGLAYAQPAGTPIFLGWCGSFFDTLEAM